MKYDFELEFSTRNSLSLILQRIKKSSTVLEFGCASGRMTQYLKEKLDCNVYGVEIDEDAAKDTIEFAQEIVVDDIESYSWKEKFCDIKFDHIIFADVLEHLYYPDKVLQNLREFLKEDGSILISIPNIAHNSIVIDLLKNQFNYSKNGLLDDTHIRFFTKNTFDTFIKDNGYFRSYETGVYLSPTYTEFNNSYDELPKELGKYLLAQPWGEIYQLVYELKKNEVDIESDFKIEHKNFGSTFIQLFVDEGNGISEENSFCIHFTNQKQISFDLSSFKNIKSLRLDPTNKPVFMRLDSVYLDESYYEGEFTSNAFDVKENIYYFDHDDPQIYFDVNSADKIDKVTFNFEYLALGEDAVREIPALLRDTFLKKDSLILQNSIDIKQKDKDINELKDVLEIKDTDIKHLEESIENKNIQIEQVMQRLFVVEEIAQSLRIRNRVKNILKKILPVFLKDFLKSLIIRFRVFKSKYGKFKSLAKQNGSFFTLKQYFKGKFYKTKGLSFKKNEIEVKIEKNIQAKISIVIPTYNGLNDLVKLIPQLLNQKGFENIEIVIIDSSSSDGTKEFINNFSDIKFISIEQKDFSHSYARNLGFENCDGEYVLFLVQDALPSSNMWLYNFVNILINNDLVALSCAQTVNSEADLYTCYGIDNFNKYLGLDKKITRVTEKYIDDNDLVRKLAQLDNVSCIFQSSVFDKYKFRGKYAEDLDIGLRLIKDGQKIGMTSEVSVIHSHLRPSYYYMKRALVETEVLNEIMEKKINTDQNIDSVLCDIYTTFYLIGSLLGELERKSTFPVEIDNFKNHVNNELRKVVAKEYKNSDFYDVYKNIFKYDEAFAKTIEEFHLNNISMQKGDLYYSMDYLINSGLDYMGKRASKIDYKMYLEFCLFILNIYATNVGVKLGEYKKQYEKSDTFITALIKILTKGV